MRKFKVGDTVRWVQAGYRTMTKDKQYTVTNTFEFDNNKQSLRVVNDEGVITNWPCIFFELFVPPKPEPKFKVGDVVRWVVTACNSMTYGNRYVVNSTYNCIDGTQNVYVIDDNGQTHCWACWRFNLVTPKPEPTYTVCWYYKGNDGELTFGTKEDALGFTSMFRDDVPYSVTKDVDV
jgi:hypothetical protein